MPDRAARWQGGRNPAAPGRLPLAAAWNLAAGHLRALAGPSGTTTPRKILDVQNLDMQIRQRRVGGPELGADVEAARPWAGIVYLPTGADSAQLRLFRK